MPDYVNSFADIMKQMVNALFISMITQGDFIKKTSEENVNIFAWNCAPLTNVYFITNQDRKIIEFIIENIYPVDEEDDRITIDRYLIAPDFD